MSCKRATRTARGQALAEGAVALMFITMLAIASILLLIGTATLLYYKLKIAYVADTATVTAVQGRYWLGAQYPYPLYDPADVEKKTKDQANSMMQQFGFASTPHVTVDQSSIKLAAVKIDAAGLPLIAGDILPSSIALNEVAARPYIQRHPIGVFGLTLDIFGLSSVGKGLYFPSYGSAASNSGPSSFPAANFPYWQSTLGPVGSPKPFYGPFQCWDGGGPFTEYSW